MGEFTVYLSASCTEHAAKLRFTKYFVYHKKGQTKRKEGTFHPQCVACAIL